jgi:Terminase small subunit.
LRRDCLTVNLLTISKSGKAKTLQEYDVHDPESLDHAWRLHDWTGEESHFAAKVLQHGNAARAYREAYNNDGDMKISLQGAEIQASKIMSQPWMASYIKFVRDKIRARMEITTERVLEELSCLAYANQADFVVVSKDGQTYTDFSGATREQMAAINELTVDTYIEGRGEDAQTVKRVKMKLAPKTAALELLGRHLGMFKGDGAGGDEDRTPKRIEIALVPRRVEPGDLD